jgi:hypothetical protein
MVPFSLYILRLPTVLLILAALIANCARGLAGRLARGLALTAATLNHSVL